MLYVISEFIPELMSVAVVGGRGKRKKAEKKKAENYERAENKQTEGAERVERDENGNENVFPTFSMPLLDAEYDNKIMQNLYYQGRRYPELLL